jgi:hypothetical protein
MLGSRRGRPSLIGRAAGTAARTAVITKTAMSVAGSSAARQQARAHEAEVVQAQRLAEIGGGAATAPVQAGGDSLEAIRKLAAAHEAGILTDAEFAVKVKERLG